MARSSFEKRAEKVAMEHAVDSGFGDDEHAEEPGRSRVRFTRLGHRPGLETRDSEATHHHSRERSVFPKIHLPTTSDLGVNIRHEARIEREAHPAGVDNRLGSRISGFGSQTRDSLLGVVAKKERRTFRSPGNRFDEFLLETLDVDGSPRVRFELFEKNFLAGDSIFFERRALPYPSREKLSEFRIEIRARQRNGGGPRHERRRIRSKLSKPPTSRGSRRRVDYGGDRNRHRLRRFGWTANKCESGEERSKEPAHHENEEYRRTRGCPDGRVYFFRREKRAPTVQAAESDRGRIALPRLRYEAMGARGFRRRLDPEVIRERARTRPDFRRVRMSEDESALVDQIAFRSVARADLPKKHARTKSDRGDLAFGLGKKRESKGFRIWIGGKLGPDERHDHARVSFGDFRGENSVKRLLPDSLRFESEGTRDSLRRFPPDRGRQNSRGKAAPVGERNRSDRFGLQFLEALLDPLCFAPVAVVELATLGVVKGASDRGVPARLDEVHPRHHAEGDQREEYESEIE